MNFSAIFHTCTDNFCYPLNERELVINIKTGYDIHRAFVIYGDPFDGTVTEQGWKWSGMRAELTEKKVLAHHLWYSVTVPLRFGRCKYYFELHSHAVNTDHAAPSGGCPTEVWCYLEDGFYTVEEVHRITGTIPCFTMPWMNEADCLSVPDWVGRTVWYQIFPDRFCKAVPDTGGEAAHNPAHRYSAAAESLSGFLPWAPPDGTVNNKDRYGGNIQGIIDKLDYIRDLGITGLYLNPINASGSVHKYDTADYLSIDPALGTEHDVRQLVQEAHRRSMKVLFDGVFNHCGWDFAPWQDVVRNGQASPYWQWFMVNNWPIETAEDTDLTGHVLCRPSGTNGVKGIYKTFAYIDYMPKLNTNHPDVIAYILNVCETWVRTYDIDGLRLDVANELSHTLCRKLRERMRSIKNDFYLLGEIWHHAMPWLRGDELDSVMNYPLARTLWKFFTDTAQPVCNLEYELNELFTLYPAFVNTALFNLLDSHDTMRIFTRMGGNADAVWQQYALLFTLPGSPCIYYGSELLLAGGEDPDNRRCMPWDGIKTGAYKPALTLIKALIALRHTHPAMAASGYRFIYETETNAANRIVHVHKYCEQATEKATPSRSIDLILNCTSEPFAVTHLISSTARCCLSHRYSKGILQSGGFLFFE